MSNAANVTNSFTNIGYTETQKIVEAFETNAATTFQCFSCVPVFLIRFSYFHAAEI